MRVLVVGVNGFLGSEIANQCLKLNCEVWGAFNRNQNNIPSGCKKIQISKIDTLEDDFEIVFISTGNFTLSNEQLSDANIITTTRISKKFRSAKLVFISSIAVYGMHEGSINERSSFNNPSAYGLSKVAGENIVKKRTKYAIVRLTNLYGKGMITKSFIPVIIIDAVKKGLINLKNKVRKHDFLSVEDAADLCIKAGQIKSNGIYIGATGKSVSNLEIAEIVQRITNCKLEFNESDQSPSFFLDPTQTMKALNWKAKKSIKSDLNSLVKFYESSNF